MISLSLSVFLPLLSLSQYKKILVQYRSGIETGMDHINFWRVNLIVERNQFGPISLQAFKCILLNPNTLSKTSFLKLLRKILHYEIQNFENFAS